MFYYTHHSDTDAPQYVHADVFSVVAVAGKIYYTLHIDMDAPRYVNADVLSDVSFV
jgi:hypothetical protein